MWLLRAELVAREGEDFQAFVLIVFVNLDQLSVVPFGNTSFRSNVDHKNGLFTVNEITEPGDFGSVKLFGWEFKEWRFMTVTRASSSFFSGHGNFGCSWCRLHGSCKGTA